MSILGRVVVYAKDVQAMVAFYTRIFGFEVLRDPADRIVELRHPEGVDPLICILQQSRKKWGRFW